MKKIAAFTIVILLYLTAATQNIKVSTSDLNAAMSTLKGSSLFDNNIFSKYDVINYKETTPYAVQIIQCRLSKYSNAFFTLYKKDTTFTGMFFNDSVYYLLKGNEFVKQNRADLFVHSNLNNADIPLPVVGSSPSMASLHYSDSMNIVRRNSIVIYVDFYGLVVSGSSWNYAGNFVVQPSWYHNSADTMDYIVAWSRELYSPFNIVVTRDSVLYKTAKTLGNYSEHIVVTPSDTFYCINCAGGVSNIGNIYTTSTQPSFVFDKALNNLGKTIRAIGHEAGHGFGLYHQGGLDGSGNRTSEYNSGYGGTVETSFAPIMGNSASTTNMFVFWNQRIYNQAKQSDDTIVGTLNNFIHTGGGFIADDNINRINGRSLSKGHITTGLIGVSDSIDYYKIWLGDDTTVTFTVTVFNMGATNKYATLKTGMRIYDINGHLKYNLPGDSTCNTSFTQAMKKGTYFVAIIPSASSYNPAYNTQPTYGFQGHYYLSYTY